MIYYVFSEMYLLDFLDNESRFNQSFIHRSCKPISTITTAMRNNDYKVKFFLQKYFENHFTALPYNNYATFISPNISEPKLVLSFSLPIELSARILAVATKQILRPPTTEAELLLGGILDHENVSLDLFPTGRSRWMRRQRRIIWVSLRSEASCQRGYPASL